MLLHHLRKRFEKDLKGFPIVGRRGFFRGWLLRMFLRFLDFILNEVRDSFGVGSFREPEIFSSVFREQNDDVALFEE